MNKNAGKKNQKDNNILNPEQEAMRLQVVDVELKARYWEAMHKVRYFTLEADKLRAEYDAHLTEEREKNMKALEELQKEMEQNKENGMSMEEVPVIGKDEIIKEVE